MASVEKTTRVIKHIGTHNGIFHCDEVLACFMLKQLPLYRDAEITRTRDSKLLNECDIVVDVGGIYNPEIHRYDHHQKSFTQTFSSIRPDLARNKNIKLSSAGLIYVHFGLNVLKEIFTTHNLTFTSEDLERIYLTVYDEFIEEIDAIDNGVPMFPEGVSPLYSINTHIGARVHCLNPEWNVTGTPDLDAIFNKAINLVGSEFVDKIMQVATIWYPARQIVKRALDDRYNVHESGKIVELINQCPWKTHLLELEKELNIENEIKFFIFPDTSNNSWRVQGVAIQPDSFICRIFLHSDWQGMRGEELSNMAGIEGCIFCHSTGFIGGNETREGAIEMALKSIKLFTNITE